MPEQRTETTQPSWLVTVRPQIAEFAALMEREMQANAHKDNHPLSHDFEHLLGELRGHVEKFVVDPTHEHAADVANLAMLALSEVPHGA